MSTTDDVPSPGRVWRWSNGAVLALGTLGLLPLALSGVGLWFSLPHVDPRDADLGADPADRGAMVYLFFGVVMMLLANGLPVGARWSARGSFGGAVLQGVCGAGVIGSALAGAHFGANIYFTGTDDACTYANCWPVHAEERLASAAGLLTGLVLILMAFLRSRLPWWVRTAVPLVVSVAGLLVHHWIWTVHLVPIFEAPPT